MMRNRHFLTLNASASTAHTTSSVAGEAVKQRLLEAGDYDEVTVTYCANTPHPYEVTFEVTKTYVIAHNPPITVYLDKAALRTADCQNYLHHLVRSVLEA